MELLFNDAPLTLTSIPTNLATLVAAHVHVEGGFAIALNGSFIPKHAYMNTLLKDQDRVDVIIPMQGG